ITPSVYSAPAVERHRGVPRSERLTLLRLIPRLALLVGLATAEAPPTAHDATSHHSFADVEHWVSVFDDPARDEWQKPAAVVRALQIGRGTTVADLGAGTGYFSHYLAAAVGRRGSVLAVDPEPNMVAHLRERAEREHTDNVVPILASLDNPRLPVG